MKAAGSWVLACRIRSRSLQFVEGTVPVFGFGVDEGIQSRKGQQNVYTATRIVVGLSKIVNRDWINVI